MILSSGMASAQGSEPSWAAWGGAAGGTQITQPINDSDKLDNIEAAKDGIKDTIGNHNPSAGASPNSGIDFGPFDPGGYCVLFGGSIGASGITELHEPVGIYGRYCPSDGRIYLSPGVACNTPGPNTTGHGISPEDWIQIVLYEEMRHCRQPWPYPIGFPNIYGPPTGPLSPGPGGPGAPPHHGTGGETPPPGGGTSGGGGPSSGPLTGFAKLELLQKAMRGFLNEAGASLDGADLANSMGDQGSSGMAAAEAALLGKARRDLDNFNRLKDQFKLCADHLESSQEEVDAALDKQCKEAAQVMARF